MKKNQGIKIKNNSTIQKRIYIYIYTHTHIHTFTHREKEC